MAFSESEGDPRNYDLLVAHFLQEALQQHTAIDDGHRLVVEPSCEFSPRGVRQVLEAVIAFDRPQLFVSRRSTPSEFGDDIGAHLDLFRDIVEHEGGHQLATAQVAARET